MHTVIYIIQYGTGIYGTQVIQPVKHLSIQHLYSIQILTS